LNNIYQKKVRECYYCKSKDLIEHSKATYWNYADLNYEECANCGLIFANPMLSLETIIFGNKALNIVHTSRGTLNQYKGGKQFSFWLNKIKNYGTILDVGCAEGFFLKGIADHSDWSVEGIDIIQSAVDFANNILGIKVYFTTLEDFKTEKKYDLIRINNVIEHCLNPILFLKKSYTLLNNNGFVWCSTPNGIQDGAVLKNANKRGIKLNLLENHLFLYKPKTLKEIFRSIGFTVIKSYCEGIKHSLKDFGLIPFSKIDNNNSKFFLSDYIYKENIIFSITDKELNEIYNSSDLKNYKLKLDIFLKKLFPIKMFWGISVGHQQFILAQKK